MAVFRVERTRDYTVMSNYHLKDTGLTLKAVGELFRNRNPKSLKVAAMLDKKERRLVKVLPDYAGFEIPDEFVVGFGLDYDEEYRNLPYIGIMKRSVYEK